MKRVLVPIDGSKASIRALEYVASRRRRRESLLVTILNVQPDITPSPALKRAAIEQWQNDMSESALSDVRIKTLKKRLGADTYVEKGDPAATIVAFAKKLQCREIVMGTHGYGAVKGMILGSVATKVIHLANIPVTLIK